MSSYFDLLPLEMIQEILNYVNLPSYLSLYQYDQFKKVLDNPFLWKYIYNTAFPNINYLVINDFTKLDFYNYYTDYMKLIQIYSKAQDFLKERDIVYDTESKRKMRKILLTTELRYVKNFKVLSLYYTTEINKEIKSKISNLWLSAYNDNNPDIELNVLRDIHGYTFSIEMWTSIFQYKVTKKDVLNLLIDLIYYNRLRET
jgi:hypothetical protein